MLLLPGCDYSATAIGAGPAPIYDEPAPLVMSAEEKAQVTEWSTAKPELWQKIQGQSNAWRAIVRTHNAWAKDQNKKKLDMMGFKKKDLEAVMKNE